MIDDRSQRTACTAGGLAHRTLLEHRREGLVNVGVYPHDLFGEIAEQHRSHVHVAAAGGQTPADLASGVVVGHDQRDWRERIAVLQLYDGDRDPDMRRPTWPNEFNGAVVRGKHRRYESR